MEVVTGEGEKA